MNDYSYRDDPAKADDSRWAHRPYTNWEKVVRRSAASAIEGKIYQRLRKLIDLRQQCTALSDGKLEVIETGSDHVFGFVREYGGERVAVLANFSEHPQRVAAARLRQHGFTEVYVDQLTQVAAMSDHGLVLEPLQLVCLSATS